MMEFWRPVSALHQPQAEVDQVPEDRGRHRADPLHSVVITGQVVEAERGAGGSNARPGQVEEEGEAAPGHPVQLLQPGQHLRHQLAVHLPTKIVQNI